MDSVRLLSAVHEGDTQLVCTLIDTGVATVNDCNRSQETALYWACAKGNVHLCQALLRRGATVDFRSKCCLTPLHAAADMGQYACAKVVLESGADPNATTNAGRTPLHLSAYRGNTAVIELLLRHGAKPDVIDDTGKTPVDQSASQSRWDDVRLLLKYNTGKRTSALTSTEAGCSSYKFTLPSHGETPNFRRQRSRSVERARRDRSPSYEVTERRFSNESACPQLESGYHSELSHSQSCRLGGGTEQRESFRDGVIREVVWKDSNYDDPESNFKEPAREGLLQRIHGLETELRVWKERAISAEAQIEALLMTVKTSCSDSTYPIRGLLSKQETNMIIIDE